MIALLLDRGADPNVRDEDGWIAKDLIAHGAALNAASNKGVTPLMIAAARDNGPMIALLLQAGSDLERKSLEGLTALDIARENGNDAALETLTLASQGKSHD
jgi:ankyrin repeat protein